MGKGDIKTRRGKITKGSYGVKRPRKRRKRNQFPKRFELIILESLSENEKPTGEILYGETIKYKKFEEPNLSSSLIKVTSKEELISSLRKINKRIKKEKVFPILHIESHGSEDGIHLSNGDMLAWEEFFDETRKLNRRLKNYLILNLAMCHGISLTGKINPLERTPFRAIITTNREISSAKLLEGFEIFYDNFFFSFSGINSVNEANKLIEQDGIKFIYLASEVIFDRLTDINRDPDFIERLINEDAVKEKSNNPEFETMDFKEVLEYSKRKVEAFIKEAKSNRSNFLMEDVKGAPILPSDRNKS